ncbi:E3 ubiquitin ligase BIG BROTHER-related [Manihot esculenta]|uniref:RING-type domain-containing protein n=1 Tax=Manihot esculenta TaxID=3983 RepID=A0A2C9U172_MANES|nr:E3 ubiquitin ligase BIG BROTHER-related [Manihot esculenta]OAY23447.1 hypothetical protein MANES_18G079700v8 [Manihot esculenta]
MENNQDGKRPMDDEGRKQAAMRGLLQEQERAFNNLTSIGSDSDEGEDYYSSEEEINGNDYEYFETLELELLEGQDSNSDNQDMEEDELYEDEEDDIDPDDLSYEELIALGEFIGEEKRGLTSEEICKCLRPWTFEHTEKRNEIERCVICQVEYGGGDDESLVVIPCGHAYHSECITNWLQIKKICPICSSEVYSPKN